MSVQLELCASQIYRRMNAFMWRWNMTLDSRYGIIVVFCSVFLLMNVLLDSLNGSWFLLSLIGFSLRKKEKEKLNLFLAFFSYFLI